MAPTAHTRTTWVRFPVALAIVGVSLWAARELAGRRPEPVRTSPTSDSPLPSFRSPATAAPLPTGPGPAETTRAPTAEVIQPHPLSGALCPQGMVWSAGDHCPVPAPHQSCPVETRRVGVCIDRFEYPNQVGVLPAVMLHFHDAARLCEAEGKRLCSESEWTLACRGTRELSACNFGHTTKQVIVSRLWNPARVSREVAAQDGRRRSRPSDCVSQRGAFDLPGNVQEWVVSEHPSGYRAALKGGRYNQSSIGCQRSVQVRQELVRLPHTGVRCCANPLVQPPGGE